MTLEQVAAYVFAFGSTPSNQVANTKLNLLLMVGVNT